MNRIDLPLRKMTLPEKLGDYYMHLADINSYLVAEERLVELYRDPHAGTRKAVLNVAAFGNFSSSSTTTHYAAANTPETNRQNGRRKPSASPSCAVT